MPTGSRRVPPASANGNTPLPLALAARTSASLPPLSASPWSTVAPLATAPIHALIAATAGTFSARDPAAYAMQLDGDCLAPDVAHGSVAIMSPAAPLTRGGFVALHFRNGRGPQTKRLASLPPSSLSAALGKPGANVTGLVLVETLNPHRLLSYRVAELLAVHAVAEIVRPVHVAARRMAAAELAGAGVTS